MLTRGGLSQEVPNIPGNIVAEKLLVPGGGGGEGGGVLGISSVGDDKRIFWGFSNFRFRYFLGTKIWQVFFWLA